MVTGWSPTVEEEDGMVVVGMTEEEREGVEEEAGETNGRSEVTSLSAGVEEGGEDTRGAVWTGGGEVSIVGGMLASGKVEGTEVAMTAETV